MGICDSLNEKQKEAVLATEGPLLILAGAGSGKTRVLTHRIAYLIEEKGVNPWNIMAITFTNKAAKEMRQRVDRLIGEGGQSVWVSTFHSTCVRILRRHIEFLGYETNFTIYDTDDQKTLVRQTVKRLNLDPKQYPEQALLSEISSAKNEMITPGDMLEMAGSDYRQKMVAQIYGEYQKQLRENNALDFDDLLMKTVELFQSWPKILEYYQDRFLYLMVDEYQDTNAVQFQFVSLLAKKHRNLCVVGDDDQSIYKFRGADIRNILNFENVFPGTKIVKLEQNYRSTTNILECANEVIQNNAGRKEKRLWTDRGEGKKVRLCLYDNGYEEAESVITEISRKVANQGRSYRQYAVLYRTNAQSRSFEEKCIAYGVPYKIVGGIHFYQRQEIKDILAYLKTIDNGRDDLSVRRIINVPRRGIGQTTVDRASLYAQEKGISFFQAISHSSEIPGLSSAAAAKLKSFVDQIYILRTQSEYMELPEFLNTLLESTGYEQELERLEPEKAQQKRENIEEMISKARDFQEEQEQPNLSSFLEEVALVADIDSLDENADFITLMTLHGAKGLEFPYVYLTGLEDGIFPGYRALFGEDPGDLEEERRLCYVGITRAMDELVLTSARMRTIRGEVQYNKLSRFVKEIPDFLLEENDASSFGKRRDGSPRKISFETEKPQQMEQKGLDALKYLPNTSRGFEKMAASGLIQVTEITGTKATVLSPKKEGELGYTVGDRVRHIRFGNGTVLELEKGKRDYEVTVEFERFGKKRMFAQFAKLKKL